MFTTVYFLLWRGAVDTEIVRIWGAGCMTKRARSLPAFLLVGPRGLADLTKCIKMRELLGRFDTAGAAAQS
eukprot:557341-Pyramimonas_sp.AAC.1